jgi:hypothetical protein
MRNEANEGKNIQVQVFWVVMPHSVTVGTDVSEVYAASIFRVK